MKRSLFLLFCLPLLSFAEGDNSDVIQKINQESAYFTTLHAQTQGLINNLSSDISSHDYSEVLDNIYSCLYGQVYNYIFRNNNLLTSIDNKFNPIDYSGAIDSINSKIVDYTDYLQAIEDGQKDYTSILNLVNSNLSDVLDDLSSLSSDNVQIKDRLSSIKNYLTGDQKLLLQSIDGKILDYSSSISSIDSKLSDLGDISDLLSSIDDKIFDYSSSFQTANSRLSNISSLLSSIDSKLSSDGFATEETLSSVDSKLISVDDYFSSDKVYDDSAWSDFRQLFNKTVIVPIANYNQKNWSPTSSSTFPSFVTSIYPSSSPNNFTDGVLSYLGYIYRSSVDASSSRTIFERWFYYTYYPFLQTKISSLASESTLQELKSSLGSSVGSDLSSIKTSVGDSLGSDVSQIQITLSDIKSLLENFDQGGGSSGGSEDPSEDPWTEFCETYLTLFDNQPISNYEIDYALIAWETNSVATKETLTHTSGNFFDLCLAFAMDANKIAASESIFLHKILDYLPNLKPPEEKDTTEDETRIDTEITDVSGQISTLQQTFNYEDLVFKQGATDFFDHDTITGQFDEESLPANVTIIIPPFFTFQTQVFNISTSGFADFFDYTRAFCAVLYYVLLCGFIWFVFKGFILCCTKFARVLGFVLQW